MQLALLVGCLSRYLDAPYVLSTGLPPILQLQSSEHALWAQTAAGTYKIDGSGAATLVSNAPITQVEAEIALPAAAGSSLATAIDAKGRTYFVRDGDEPALFRVDGEQTTLIAEWLGPVTDMTFGSGGLLPPENLYLSRSDGVVAYLRPP